MSNDLRQNGEERDEEVQYESSSSISDAESCSSDSEEEATSDQEQPSESRKLDAYSRPLYDFSSLMAQLPNQNRRGLSQYYEGKSQSFTSLSDVKGKEDLPKKMQPYKRRIKTCKSYADGLSDQNQDGLCNQTPSNRSISRTTSRGSCGNLLARNNGSNLMCRPPTIPLNKNSTRLS